MNLHLLNLGWNKEFQQQLDGNENTTSIPARIIREDRARYTIHTGEHSYTAQLAGSCRNMAKSTLDLPTVGDWVLFEPTDSNQGGFIHAVLQRQSLFTRQASGKRSDIQLLAANIDYLFVVAGLDQEFNTKRIQRFLAQAWDSGAKPVIILNKSDLIEDAGALVEKLHVQFPDVFIHITSALTQDSFDCLAPYLQRGNTVALSGSSGVGKSSLINALLGQQKLKTQENRADDNRGRHTTSWRELIQLNSGACIIDLPGIRELQLTEDSKGVDKAFTDIRILETQCKFRNCQHGKEPGCAIKSALESNQLSEERYHQYLKLRNETHNARRPKPKPVYQKPSKPQKWEEKERFFKDVKIRHRKNNKAKRKYHQEDGF